MSDVHPRRLATLLHLGLALVLALIWAYALQRGLGGVDRALVADARAVTVQPTGHRVYILMIDALRADEVASMPHLAALAQTSFSAELEPCLDLFTTACMRQALTGRPSFDLLAPFEDFGVAKPNVGPNLLRDALAAGKHVEMLSTGHLGAFRGDVSADPRVHEPFSWKEVDQGLEIAKRSDLVLHHWVWHDLASHHMLRKPADHLRKLAEADEAVSRILAGLPDGMDLIVMGDHGHFTDGRHLQGMDLPTSVVVHSANLRAGHIPGRVTISAIRFLGSAVTGLLGPAVPADPAWADWLSPEVAAGWRGGAPIVSADRSGPGLPVLGMTLILGALVVASTGLGGGLAMGWAVLLGAAFGAWLGLVDQQVVGPEPEAWYWLLPTLGLVGGLGWRRSLDGAWAGGVLACGALLLGLYPGLKSWGVLGNISLITSVPVIGAGVLAGLAALKGPESRTRRLGLVLALAAATVIAAVVLDRLCWIDANFFQVRSYPSARWARSATGQADALAALLAGVGHLLVDPSPWALLSAAGAAFGRQIPPELHMATVGLLAGATVFGRGRWRARCMSLGATTASAYLFPGVQRVGVLAVVAGVGLGLRLIARHDLEQRPARWAAAFLVVAGGYLGLAWTCGLNTAGINYSFAVQWTEGPWHERLWWLMGLATALQIFVPALLIGEQVRAAFGDRSERIATAAGQLALVRFAVVLTLATVWLFVGGGQAATLRLSVVLQDALAWLLLGLVGVGSFALGARPRYRVFSYRVLRKSSKDLRSM